MSTWKHETARVSHVLPVLANIFCIKITEFVRQQNADILSCNYRLIMTQHNADKWMDCIWRLINSTHRAGSGPAPLAPPMNTALCIPNLNYSCPTYSRQIIQGLLQILHTLSKIFLKKEKNKNKNRVASWTLNTFLCVWYPKHGVKALRHMTAFSHEKHPSLLFTAVMASALPRRNSLYTFETLLL